MTIRLQGWDAPRLTSGFQKIRRKPWMGFQEFHRAIDQHLLETITRERQRDEERVRRVGFAGWNRRLERALTEARWRGLAV